MCDDGIGIAPGVRERIFRLFTQGASAGGMSWSRLRRRRAA